MGQSQIEFAPIAGALGAEVSGVDMREPLSPENHKVLHDGWMEHLVLFFRDQSLTRDQHKDFARNFGELHVHPVLQPLKDEGHPEIVVLVSDKDRKFVAEKWHSDVTFQRVPPMGSILHGVTVPKVGGDTMWANMYAAYEALSDTMQRLLSGLKALNHGGGFRAIASKDQEKSLDEDLSAVHPIVRTHPVTGRKALFVNSAFTKGIDGMKPAESHALLRFLYAHIDQPEFTCRFRWRDGSVAMWDNRCTQHRVLKDNLHDLRRMERVTLVGDSPPQ